MADLRANNADIFAGKYLRCSQILSSLGRPPLDRLDALLQLFLDRLFGLSLDGRAHRLGPAVEVARQFRSAGKAAAVPCNELIESSLELRLFETIVASSRNDARVSLLFCLLLSRAVKVVMRRRADGEGWRDLSGSGRKKKEKKRKRRHEGKGSRKKRGWPKTRLLLKLLLLHRACRSNRYARAATPNRAMALEKAASATTANKTMTQGTDMRQHC